MTEQLRTEKSIGYPRVEKEPCLTLAYLGPVGTFTHDVALGIVAHDRFIDARLIEATNITEIVEMVKTGAVSYGVIPIENSTDGHITDTMKALIQNDDITIVAEVIKAIQLYWYMRPDCNPQEIRSKNTVEYQAKRHLEKLFPNVPFHQVDSTALGVTQAADDPTIVGIGSEYAARSQGLEGKLIRSDASIEDNPNNATTFVVIRRGKEETPVTGNDKTSFIISIPHTKGSLYRILDGLDQRGINLNKIKSLMQLDSQVWFLMSTDGHETEENLAEVLSSLEKKVPLKRLGSYPKADYTPRVPASKPDIEKAIGRIKNAQNGSTSAKDQTTIVFTLPNKPGALKRAIKPFNEKGVNLTMIDSQASGEVDTYIFGLSFENHVPNREKLLEEVAAQCEYIKVLV